MFSLAFVILACSWLVSDHFPPWLSFHAEVPAFLATMLALVGMARLPNKGIQLPVAAGVIGVIALIPLMQYAGGMIHYFGDLLVSEIYVLTFAIAWAWGYQWVRWKNNQEWLNTLAIGAVLIGFAVLFQLLAQWLRVDDLWVGWVLHHLPNSRPRANIGQPNQAATTLLMAVVGLGILRTRGQISNAILFIVGELFAIGLILTQSRTAMLSAIVLVVTYMLFWLKQRSKKDRSVVLLIWFWLSSLFLGSYIYTLLDWDGVVSATVTVGQLHQTGTRPLIWSQIWTAITAKPLTGWGWLQVAKAQQFGAISNPGFEQVAYAHNVVLDSIIYSGLLATAIIFLVGGLWIWRRLHRIFEAKEEQFLVLMLIPLLVHACLEFPHTYSYFLVIGGVLLGAVDATTCTIENVKHINVSRLSGVVAMTLWAVLLTSTAYEYWNAEEDFRVNRFENLRIGETPAEYVPPKLHLLTQLGDLLHAMRLRAKRGMSEEELETLEATSMRYTWGKLQFRAALAFGLNGYPDKATERMRVIKSLFPAEVYTETLNDWWILSEKYPELLVVKLP